MGTLSRLPHSRVPSLATPAAPTSIPTLCALHQQQNVFPSPTAAAAAVGAPSRIASSLRASQHLVPASCKVHGPSGAAVNPSSGPDSRSTVESSAQGGGGRNSSRRSRGWDDDGGASESAAVQRLLVDMVRLQVGEMRMNEMVEERSARMRSIARDSQEELDRIAHRAMKGVDDLSDRVLRQLDAGAFAIERDLAQARREMEQQQKECEEFERRVFVSRNEGLFFKNLYSPPSTVSPRGSRYSMRRRSSAAVTSSPSAASSSLRESRIARSRSAAAASAVSATAAGSVSWTPEEIEEMQSSGGEGVLRHQQMQQQQQLLLQKLQEQDRGMSVYRHILHAGMSLVLVSFMWSSANAFVAGHPMRLTKLSAYTAIFSVMLLQLKFEKEIMGQDVEDSETDSEGESSSSSHSRHDSVSAPPLKEDN